MTIPTSASSRRASAAPQSPLLAVTGLILLLGLPQLGLEHLFEATVLGARFGREIVWIGYGTLLLFWVLRVERLPLSSIGLHRPGWGTLGWGLAATIMLMASVMFSFAVIGPAFGLSQNMAATKQLVQVPIWLFFLTPVVAGITEELIYRGYAIERLTLLTGRRWLGAILAAIAFVVAHWSWGALQMIVVAFGTIILVGLYLWRRDLACCMAAHVATDLIGLALARGQA